MFQLTNGTKYLHCTHKYYSPLASFWMYNKISDLMVVQINLLAQYRPTPSSGQQPLNISLTASLCGTDTLMEVTGSFSTVRWHFKGIIPLCVQLQNVLFPNKTRYAPVLLIDSHVSLWLQLTAGSDSALILLYACKQQGHDPVSLCRNKVNRVLLKIGLELMDKNWLNSPQHTLKLNVIWQTQVFITM